MTDTDLASRRFVVVGAGGVGGWLLQGLAKMLEYKAPGSTLVVVDGDHFEPKNLERQAFGMAGNKAEVRAAELQATLDDTIVIPLPSWVVNNDHDIATDEVGDGYVHVQDVVRENDVVFAVVDNFATRKLIFDAAKERDTIDVFTGGNDDNLFGSVTHYARENGHDTLEHPEYRHVEYVDPKDRNPGDLSCEERAQIEGGTQLLATNMAVAAYLLGRVQKVIVEGQKDNEAEIYFDLGAGLAQAYDRREEDVVVVAAPK